MSKDSIEFRVTYLTPDGWPHSLTFTTPEAVKRWLAANRHRKVEQIECRSVSSWEHVPDFDPVEKPV